MRSKSYAPFSPREPVPVRQTSKLWRLAVGLLAIPMVCGVVLAGSALLGEEPWKEKPYTHWTPDEVLTVLSNSPWGRIVSIVGRTSGRGSPDASEREALAKRGRQGATGTPSTLPGDGHVPFSDSEGIVTRTQIAVRWISSRTFREAIVRAYQFDSRLDVAAANQFLETHPTEYIIGVNSQLASEISREDWAKQVGTSAYLEMKKSKRRIHPLKWEPTEASLAPLAKVIIYFPKTIEGQPIFAPTEDAVRFHFDFPSGKKTKHLKVTFPLKKMVRDGAPDL